jgi:RimJ/RimL family protein N-acetyltransferase
MMPPELCTKRLRILPLRSDHLDGVYPLYADPLVNSDFEKSKTYDEVREIVRRRLEPAPDGMGHCVFELDDKIVGFGKLRPSDELPGDAPEIGWRIRREKWGKGLAKEAARGLLEHGFGTLALSRIWAIVHPGNAPSIGLAQRLGFRDAEQHERPADIWDQLRIFVISSQATPEA